LGRTLDAIAPYDNDIEEAIVLGVLFRFGKIDTDRYSGASPPSTLLLL
jgi:hypothetical protein